MIDPNIIDYYLISCAIPSIITVENRYQIDFGKPDVDQFILRQPDLGCWASHWGDPVFLG